MFLCAPYWVQIIHKMHDVPYLHAAHSYQVYPPPPGQIVQQTMDKNSLEKGAKPNGLNLGLSGSHAKADNLV